MAFETSRGTGIEAVCAEQIELRSKQVPDTPVSDRKVRIADLCSGCGGLSLGVRQACLDLGFGFEVVLANDLDPTAQAVFEKNFSPIEFSAESIEVLAEGTAGATPTKSEAELAKKLGALDLVVAGPPCQGHSALNNHTRHDDTRNLLYLKVVRFVEVTRPFGVIIENVPAILVSKQPLVETALSDLRQLGYCVYDTVFDLGAFGVPQRRKRHVLIAVKSHAPNLGDLLKMEKRENKSVKWAIGDLEKFNANGIFDTASTLSAENQRRAQLLLSRGLRDLPNQERPTCHKDKKHSYVSMYGRLNWDKPAQTITTGFGSPGQGRYLHPSLPRTLTPHEAARLQMFPDYFDWSAAKLRGQLARLIGNAAPPPLARRLATVILSLSIHTEVKQ